MFAKTARIHSDLMKCATIRVAMKKTCELDRRIGKTGERANYPAPRCDVNKYI